MKKNMGTIDRVVRFLVAVAVLVLFLVHVISGPLAIVLGVIAAVFVLTSFVGVCPLYIPLKLSTATRR
jgi:1,4-dihydroxy-2-naphthoate octaprenyltransferase